MIKDNLYKQIRTWYLYSPKIKNSANSITLGNGTGADLIAQGAVSSRKND